MSIKLGLTNPKKKQCWEKDFFCKLLGIKSLSLWFEARNDVDWRPQTCIESTKMFLIFLKTQCILSFYNYLTICIYLIICKS